MNRLLIASMLLLPLASCASVPMKRPSDNQRAAWSAPPLTRAVCIRNGRTGEELSFNAFLDALAKADVVFLGEQHTDETTHRLELAVYEGLLARRDGKVVLAMEMFERDVQPALDAYLGGEIDESAFLAEARPWSNYDTAYRPLIEAARSADKPVIASNFPQPLRRRVAIEGPQVLESLTGDEKREAPGKLFPETAEYWRRVDNAIRSHRMMMMGRGGDDDDNDRLYDTQSLWDNCMGESCARALDAHPGYEVLHVNGGFHSEYWDGAVRQLTLRKPNGKVVTVAIVPVTNPSVATLRGAPEADFVAFVEARATDLNEGKWSVYVSREQPYRLHMPKDASDEHHVPLLIWLNDDGLTAADGLDLWKERLGDDVAIAVLEPAYPAVQPDLSTGGRWFWPDTFAQDISGTMTAVERAWAYLLRHYPIDPKRVCVAGEGTGGTVVAAIGLLTDRMNVNAVALRPAQYAKVKDFPLPLPELYGDDAPPKKSLRVVLADPSDSWWAGEIGEYVDIGLDAAVVTAEDESWEREQSEANVIRSAMSMEARPVVTSEDRPYVLIENDSPRARQWARLRALREADREGKPVAVLEAAPDRAGAREIPTEIDPGAFAALHALPRCPGPFGGTTVVVVPNDAASDVASEWIALEENDPLAKESRFHRVRIVTGRDDRTLPDVLEKLRSERRENILIVPAVFCADAAQMRSLQTLAKPFEDRMTLHWLPGLGGQELERASASGESD